MLAIDGTPHDDPGTGQVLGLALPVTWVPIPEPDPAAAETDQSAVFLHGFAAGGARFARLEGCWHGQGGRFIVSTNGGDAGAGQVWENRPHSRNTGTLTRIFESPGEAVLDAPDHLTVSPHGGLLRCEDGDAAQCLRGITRTGASVDCAENLRNDSEWAGATFIRADGDGDEHEDEKDDGGHLTLFVNRQGPTSRVNPPPDPENRDDTGMTLAIWGPWKKGALR
jgi:secreted PhoX family phosphatase